jgi:hypothetical protein
MSVSRRHEFEKESSRESFASFNIKAQPTDMLSLEILERKHEQNERHWSRYNGS